jgi:hypothetical protein
LQQEAALRPRLPKRLATRARFEMRLRARGLARAAELDWRGFAAANLALYRRVLDGAA